MVGPYWAVSPGFLEHFDGDDRVDVVMYPGLPGHPGHQVATRAGVTNNRCGGAADSVRLLIAVRALSTAAGLDDLPATDRFLGAGTLTDAGPIRSPFPDTIPDGVARDPGSIIDHAFVMAINVGRHRTAAMLLDAGARINAKPPGCHRQSTALHAAVWRGDHTLVEWLPENGADPHMRDGLADSDAAGWARHHGHAELVELFSSR